MNEISTDQCPVLQRLKIDSVKYSTKVTIPIQTNGRNKKETDCRSTPCNTKQSYNNAQERKTM